MKKLLLSRMIIALAAVVALAGFTLGNPAPSSTPTVAQSAAPVHLAANTIGPVTINCGIVTCSAYLSRSKTKEANSKITVGGGGFAAVATVYCGAMGVAAVPLGIACAAAAAVHGPWIAQEIGTPPPSTDQREPA